MKRSLCFGIAAVLLLVTALRLHMRPHSPPPHLCSIPSQFEDWAGTDLVLDGQTRDILGPGEFLFRDYENASHPQLRISFQIMYLPKRKPEDIRFWIPPLGAISQDMIQVARPDGSSFPVNRYVISNLRRRQLELIWFQAHGRADASENWAVYHPVYDLILMNRSDGGIVRLGTPMLDGESADAAQSRIMKLGSQFLPLLDRCIPR